ncbi:MAG: ABC transporter permease [Bacillota bacterium]
MWKYVVKRLLALVPVLVGVSIFVFMLIHLTPGDPALIMLGETAPPEQLESMREQMGLNEPLPVQYVVWAKDAVQLDFGRSLRSRKPVIVEILDRLPNTAYLALSSIILAVVVGIPVGVLSAAKPNSFFDNLFTGISFAAVGMPVFWQGLMLILIFSVYLGWFPSSGMGDNLSYFVLPTVALATVTTARIVRITRSSMMDVLKEDYIRTARAKGVKENSVIYKHALRNSLIPVVTIIGLSLGRLMGGAVLTETIFAWPGMGRMIVDAIRTKDFPLVQGSIMIFAVIYALVNLGTDLFYAVLDPQLRTKYE